MTKPIELKPLTTRQLEIARVFAAYLAEHGIWPTLREVGERLDGGASKATIHGHLCQLERKGWARCSTKSKGAQRTWRLTTKAQDELEQRQREGVRLLQLGWKLATEGERRAFLREVS